MGTKTLPTSAKDTKGIRTKETILKAARKVFSEHPYHAASMRMIGKEAGIEHPLINYYFPSKAELFEAIIRNICDEFTSSNEEWFNLVKESKTSDGFIKYIDRLLDFNQLNPEPLRILALNVSQAQHISQIPGYQHFPELIENIRKIFEEKISLKGAAEEIRMYIHSFIFLVIAFLGASPCIAQVQGMDPGSSQYREWVRNTLLFIFLPRLRDIINPRAPGKNIRKKKLKKR
jgi:TetR/AcrR family transcriptional regulator